MIVNTIDKIHNIAEYAQVVNLAELLQANRCLAVSLEDLPIADKQRVIDYFIGTVFSLEGKVYQHKQIWFFFI